MNYKQQVEKDKPIVETWNEAMQKEITARLVKHFGYNMEVLCGRNVYGEQQLTTKLTDVNCNGCLTILSWMVKPECLATPPISLPAAPKNIVQKLYC